MKSGELILACDPFVHVAKDAHRRSTCDECLNNKSSSLNRCAGCHYVYYCNRGCQRVAWKEHKHECGRIKFLTSVPLIGQIDFLRLVAKIIIKLRQGDQVVTTLPDGSKRTFKDLMSHKEEIRKCDQQMKLINFYHEKLKGFFMGFGGVPNKEDVLEVYGKLKINCFSIEGTGGYGFVGTGLYLESSAIDHSCSPNSEGSYIGKKMFVKCVRDEPGGFSKIRLCYSKMLPLREERQKHLKKNYYFDCKCGECSDVSSMRDAYGVACIRCPKCTKGVPVNEESKGDNVTCGHCKKLIPVDHITTYWAIRAEIKGLLCYYNGEIPELIAHGLVRRMKSVFFPTERNYLVMLKDCLHDSTEQSTPPEALETAREILEAYKMIYAPYSNEICRLHVHIAHLYCACGQIRSAKDEFDIAKKALSKCYPPSHSFMKSPMFMSVEMALIFI